MARRRRDPFAFRVALIAAAGLVVRIAYLLHLRTRTVDGDGTYYHAVANLLADGKLFVDPAAAALRRSVSSAAHPPLWTITLGLFARLGLRSILQQQFVAALIGVATIVAIAYAGRRIAGARVGLIAAVIAAIAPTFIFYEWELLSETLTMLGAALTLLFAYRFRDEPSLLRAALVGLMCGLLALTHADQGLLVVFLLAPLVLLARDVAWRTRWAWLAIATAVAIGVVLPWSAYNTARFRDPVLLSTELGATLVEANCNATYSGTRLGWADGQCRLATPANVVGPHGDESTRDAAMRRVAFDFIGDHLGRLPVVIAAREGRVWGVFRPGQQMHFDASRGTPDSYTQVGFFVSWALDLAAVAGVVVLRRRKIPVYPLLAFLATVVIGVALTFGATRYRAPAEVSMALLAATGLEAGLRILAARAGLVATPVTGPVTSSAPR